MAALPKMGATPQQIIVAKAKTKGEVFTESLLFSGNGFPLFTPYIKNPSRKEKGVILLHLVFSIFSCNTDRREICGEAPQ
jgi:hypothetical protein